MAIFSPQKNSFNSGEVSPSIYARTDVDKYRSSLRTCRNFIIHPQGGASNRCGFEYINSSKYSSSMSIVQEFIFSNTQAYVLEFGHYYVRFYTDGEQITSGGSAYEISTPYSYSDIADLNFESSADVIWITHPNYQTRTLTRYGSANWVLETYEVDDGPFMPENIDETVSMSVSAVSGSGVTLTISTSTSIDSQTVFLCHADGSNGSTSFTDDVGNTITANGNAQVSTAQNKFGGASLLLDGSSDYLTVSDSSSWDFGTGDFTLEMFVYFNSLPTSGNRMALISHYDGVSGQNGDWFWEVYNNTGTYQFRWGSYNGSFTIISKNISSISTGSWYHFRVLRTSNTIRFFKDGVQVSTDGTDSTDLTRAGSTTLNIGDFPGGGASTSAYFDEIRVSKGIARDSGTAFTAPTSAFSITNTSTPTYTFSSLHVGALFKLRHYVEGQTASSSFTSSTTGSSIKCFTTWRLITHGTWTGKLRIEKSIDNGTTWTVLRSFSSSNDSNFDTSGTEDIEANPVPFLVRANMYSYTSGTATVDLTTDPFYQDGIVRATAYISTTSLTVTVIDQIGSTSSTTSWSEGSFSDYRGYPKVARFFQDRLAFSATQSEPQTTWLTVTGDYYSFKRNQTLLDTDGITVNLPSRQLNEINSLVVFKKLIAFTGSSIWSIGPISGTALTPTSIDQSVEEYVGAEDIAPAVIGNEALFCEFGSETIRNIGYQLQSDGFTGAETNILAKHLFEGYSITKLAYQRKPNSILWCLRSDGVLLSLTYLKEQDVVAWARHDTDGVIKSICVIPGDTSDELWAVVNRDNGYFIERSIGRKQHNLSNQVFLDSYKSFSNSTSVVSGLSHLQGQYVYMLADGQDLSSQVVSASGTLSMSSNYTDLYVGLQYLSDIETLNIDIPSQTGSIQGNSIKVGNVVFRLINTRGGYIGPNEDTLYEAFDYATLNNANLKNKRVALGTTENFSGDVRKPLGGGYEDGGRIFIRQSKPLPITITEIIPDINVGSKSG